LFRKLIPGVRRNVGDVGTKVSGMATTFLVQTRRYMCDCDESSMKMQRVQDDWRGQNQIGSRRHSVATGGTTGYGRASHRAAY